MMNSNVEKAWINLTKYLGVAQPEYLDDQSLLEWARPDKLHPSRKNRPLLLRIFNDAKVGSLSKYIHSKVMVGKESIVLGSVFEFQTLLNLTQQSIETPNRSFALDVVKQISPKAGKLLEDVEESKLLEFTNFVQEFVDMDYEMYQRSIDTKKQFETEKTKLENLRDALIELKTQDQEDRLNYLQSFESEVLIPLVSLIRITESSRELYSQHLKGTIADMLMTDAGMQVVGMDFPDFSLIEQAIEGLPRLDEKKEFEKFKSDSGLNQVNNLVHEFYEQLQNKFDAKIDINPSEMVSFGKRGVVVHAPHYINYGGEQKNVYYNPHNTIQS